MLKRIAFLFTAVFFHSTVSQIVAEVLEGPRGPVEFIGLEEWTASELFEAIKETDPDKPFHACAAVLKSELNFPDAAAFGTFKTREDGSQELYTVIVGVENSSHVRYRTAGKESLELPNSWQALQTKVEESFHTHSAAVYIHFLLATPENAEQFADLSAEDAEEKALEFAELFGASVESFAAITTFIEATGDESEHRLALEVLEKDKSWSARFIAAIVLARFPNEDETWHGLADSLIDPAPQVRDVAEKVLDGLLSTEKAMPIDWAGARDTLVALLGGTNPWAFETILNLLRATEVDSKFALELVQQRPNLLLGYAAAEHEKTRQVALTFLQSISDEDFKQDVEAWEDWIGETDQEAID